MAEEVTPEKPRGAKARSLFTSGCLGYAIAAVLFFAGVVLLTAGQLPAIALIVLAVVVALLSLRGVRKAEPNVR